MFRRISSHRESNMLSPSEFASLPKYETNPNSVGLKAKKVENNNVQPIKRSLSQVNDSLEFLENNEMDVLMSRAHFVQFDRRCRRPTSAPRLIIEDYEEKWIEDFGLSDVEEDAKFPGNEVGPGTTVEGFFVENQGVTSYNRDSNQGQRAYSRHFIVQKLGFVVCSHIYDVVPDVTLPNKRDECISDAGNNDESSYRMNRYTEECRSSSLEHLVTVVQHENSSLMQKIKRFRKIHFNINPPRWKFWKSFPNKKSTRNRSLR